MVGNFYKDRIFEHDGHIPNSGVYFSHRLDNRLTVVVMAEMAGAKQVGCIAQDVLDHLLCD